MAQLAESSDQGGQRFHFDALVRGLCNSSDMVEHLQAKMSALNHKQANASARLASLLEEQPFQDKTNTPVRLALTLLSVQLTLNTALNTRSTRTHLVVVVTSQHTSAYLILVFA